MALLSLAPAIPGVGPAVAAPVAGAVPAAPAGPTSAAAMPGPVGSVETSSWFIDEPDAIAVAGDGSAWIQNVGGAFGRMGLDGDYRSSGAWGREFTTGPDGAIWSTIFSTVYRLEIDGSSTSFDGGDYGDVVSITTGPDGNLWFTTAGYQDVIPVSIVRLTPAGVITNFPDASLTCRPTSAWAATATCGSVDGADVGRITPAGDGHPLSRSPPGTAAWDQITLGPDGNVWLADEPSPAANR